MSFAQIGRKPPPGFDDPVGMLLACHGRIHAQLEILERVVTAFREGGDDRLTAARLALADPLRYFAEAGVRHSLDEDASVFPRVVHPATAELTTEHRELEAIFMALRTVAVKMIAGDTSPALVDDLAQHVAALATGYREHMRKDETDVFPLVAALDEKELRAIGIEMRIRRG
jgi:hemerythrin-like domain-containing protein